MDTRPAALPPVERELTLALWSLCIRRAARTVRDDENATWNRAADNYARELALDYKAKSAVT